MLLVLKRSAEQESALRRLLDDQQDKSSSSYHRWLTPEDFGRQFGPTDVDIQTITAWLQSHGFQVGSSKGRTVLEFSGTAGQVQDAFHTTIHKYLVNGEQHWANASDPQIPAALTPAVAGIASLNNFPRHPMMVSAGTFQRDRATGKITPIHPELTFPSGCVEDNSSQNSCLYGIGPYDFATIYNVLPLWNSGIDGTGQTIAIVGETNINIQDVRNFRSLFGLPANDPTIMLNGPDPGIQSDEVEANLDVQWSGAVAPNATIDFVVSQSTETTAGIDLSAVYIVDNNLAPVMSESYGLCELGLGTAGNQFYNALWQQAAAQGITVFISAGDGGAAGCDNFDAQSPAPAQFGLQVSGFASTPYNVAVGGTDFNDFSNPGTYWKLTSDPVTQESAKGYIPETTWNSSCTNAIFGTVGYSTNAETNCNDSQLTPYFDVPLGGSGGVSNCTTPSGSTATSCAGGYAKPSWQTGTGVPNDGKRDIPDVSLFASNGFLNNFYMICQSDAGGYCFSGTYTFLGIGGTSASSPAFAGIMALVNQQMASQALSPRQGNANYIFYKLASQQPTAFHDVTSGTIAMPCLKGTPNCTTTNSAHPYGVMTGYNAGTGYDLATGLGSVNAQNLVTNWSSVVSLGSTTTLNSLTPTTITHGQPVNFSVTVQPKSGMGTPTGQVSLFGAPAGSNNQAIGGFSLSGGAVSGSTQLLPGGTYSVTAHYPGDSAYMASDSAPVSVTVNKESSQPQIFLVTFDSSGHIVNSNTNTAVYGSPYVLRVNVDNSAGALCSPTGSSGATGCPTGTVSLTNNGSSLDAGIYTLNSYGYVEDEIVQLPGGTDSVKAAYSGDNSFKTSSATSSMNITPAATSMAAVGSSSVYAGYPFELYTDIETTSSGAGPTGTVTLFANGSPLSATTTLTPVAGTANSSAYTGVTAIVTLPSPGTYTFSASYAGDSNYVGSTAPASPSITVKYPMPTLYLKSTSYSVAPGTGITLTAEIISTGNLTPTGTVSFTDTAGNIPGVLYSTIFNPTTGYTDLVATVTTLATFSDNYFASYSGDTNYPTASSGSGLVTVTGNDFSLLLGQPSVALVRGQTGTIPLVVGMQGNPGTQGSALPVTFTAAPCTGLPSESTCTAAQGYFSYTGTTQLYVYTTAASVPNISQTRGGAVVWTSVSLLLGAGFFIAGRFDKRTICNRLIALFLAAFLVGLPGCGGSASTGTGSGGGGGGNPGTPTGTYPVTITAVSGTGSSAITHTVVLTLTVQ